MEELPVTIDTLVESLLLLKEKGNNVAWSEVEELLRPLRRNVLYRERVRTLEALGFSEIQNPAEEVQAQ